MAQLPPAQEQIVADQPTEPVSTITNDLFAQDAVKKLTTDDFELDSSTKINLVHKDCTLVLFYTNNTESKNLFQIWSEAAKEVAGPVFASVNLLQEKQVAKAFTKLNMTAGSLKWAALRTIPFILVYHNGWPVAFYNGQRSVQALIDYSLALACKADYHEPVNVYGGMQSQNDLEIKGTETYGPGERDNPLRHDSLQFLTSKPLRPYDKSDRPVEAGSAQAQAEASAEQTAAAQQGIGVESPTAAVGEVPEGVRAAPVAGEQ